MKTKHILQMLALSAIWGVSFVLIHIAGTGFSPLWVGTLRSASGAFLLWGVVWLGRFPLPSKKLLPWLFVVALANNAIPFCFFAWGEQSVPSSTAAVLDASVPLWTLLLSFSSRSGRVSLLTVLGVLVGFVGVAVVVFTHTASGNGSVSFGSYLFGVLLITLAAIGYAVATVLAKTKLQGVEPIGLATAQLTLAALALLPLALLSHTPLAWHARPLLAILALGFVGSGVAYILFFQLLAQVPATHVASVTYLLPLWGIFWGWLAQETISPYAFLGVAIVLVGLAMMSRSSQVSCDELELEAESEQLALR